MQAFFRAVDKYIVHYFHRSTPRFCHCVCFFFCLIVLILFYQELIVAITTGDAMILSLHAHIYDFSVQTYIPALSIPSTHIDEYLTTCKFLHHIHITPRFISHYVTQSKFLNHLWRKLFHDFFMINATCINVCHRLLNMFCHFLKYFILVLIRNNSCSPTY